MSDAQRDLQQRIAEADAAGDTDRSAFLRGVLQLQIDFDNFDNCESSVDPSSRAAILAEEEAAYAAHLARIRSLGRERGLL